MMAQRLARRDWRSGGPRFKSHPRLTFQSWSSYQLNQLGSKAASDSTLKQLTTCGVSNTCTSLLFFLLYFMGQERGVWGGLVSLRIGSVNVTTMRGRDSMVLSMAARGSLDFSCLQETGWRARWPLQLLYYQRLSYNCDVISAVIIISLTSIFFQDKSRVLTAASQQH